MSRRAFAWTVLALWAVGLAWLTIRTVRLRLQPPEAGPVAVNPGAAFLALELAGVQVGLASATVDTLATGVAVQSVLLLDVPEADGLRRFAATTNALLTTDLALVRFSTRFVGDVASFVVRGDVDGDSLIRLTLVAGRDSARLRQPVTGPVVLAQHVPLALGLRPYQSGDSTSIEVFDPFALRPTVVRVVAGPESTFVVPDSATADSATGTWTAARWDTVPARRFDLGGLDAPITIWVDPEGAVVRALLPGGAIATRRVYEMAYENYRRHPPSHSPFGVVGWVDPLRPPAGQAGGSAAFLLGVAVARLATSESAWQQASGDTVMVHLATPRPARIGPMPTGSSGWAAAQPDDPRIQALARQIGVPRDGVATARALAAWVHQALRKERGLLMRPAASVLEARSGGVNEHVILFVGLAEATGLPARPVSGIVASEGGLYAHAWAEVWLGEWVPVDPTLGQMPADVAHVRLVTGRLTNPVEVLYAGVHARESM